MGLQIALMCIAGLNTALLTVGMFILTDLKARIERLEGFRMNDYPGAERRNNHKWRRE